MTATQQVQHPVVTRSVSLSTSAAGVRRQGALLIACVIAVMLAAASLLAGRANAGALEQSSYVQVQVRQGETLSGIAAREMPTVQTADAVVQIQQVNNLGSLHVSAGEKLLVPRRS